jgi:hypothetical protein
MERWGLRPLPLRERIPLRITPDPNLLLRIVLFRMAGLLPDMKREALVCPVLRQ